MSTPKHLDTTPLPPEMDFLQIRESGLNLLEKLCGLRWTDYNVSDPGITILEQLCFALVDLGYRINLPIEDLLTGPDGEKSPLFFPPEKILCSAPVSLQDYRKLFLDLPGVHNCWITPQRFSSLSIHLEAGRNELTDFRQLPYISSGTTASRIPLHLKGLYKVMIEIDPSLTLEEKAELVETIQTQYQAHRNLAEDLGEIVIFEPEFIQIEADIEIAEGVDPEALLTKLYRTLTEEISPQIPRFTYAEMQEQGYQTEEILDGPPLQFGFIRNEDLGLRPRPKTELYSSDLVRAISANPEVRLIRSLKLIKVHPQGYDIDSHNWVIKIDDGKVARFLPGNLPRIHLFRGPLQVAVRSDIVKEGWNAYLGTRRNQRPMHPGELMPSSLEGKYRNPGHYYSLQPQFPAIYGLSPTGLPQTASPTRKAQAKQLTAYLAFFEQLLTNAFGQVAHFRELMASAENSSYANVSIRELPGMNELLLEGYEQFLEIQNTASQFERQNRLLDHLLARIGESLNDYALLPERADNSINQSRLIRDKITFLEDYPTFSVSRHASYNHTQPSWENDNVPALKKRLCRLLGIPSYQRTFVTQGAQVDAMKNRIQQLFKYPIGYEKLEAGLLWQELIPEYEVASQSLKLQPPNDPITLGIFKQTYSSEAEALNAWQQFQQQELKAWQETFSGRQGEIFFLLEHILLRPIPSDEQQNDTLLTFMSEEDPFSLQISIILPSWPLRFQNAKFKEFLERSLRDECPAHIRMHIHSLDWLEMRAFENAFHEWLIQKAQ